MDIECFLYPGWEPRIRPASAHRGWMDDTPERFAYRCLPLAIANAHGWEIVSSTGFSARWTGGSDPGAVEILLDEVEQQPVDAPVSLFGQGNDHFSHCGPVQDFARLESLDRRSTQSCQGWHRATVGHRGDRLVALQFHDELALHTAGPLVAV